MTSRVTGQINILNNITTIHRQQESLSKLQQQISSGIRIHRPSDDPLGIRLSLLQQDRLDRLESHQRAVQQSRLQLEQAHTQLLTAHDLFVRAQQIGIAGIQAIETTDRQALAAELEGILNELSRLANDSSADGALFGGGALDQLPFKISASGAASYQGANSPTRLVLGDSPGQATLISGGEVFDTPERGATLIEGRTGIAAGTGTDTAVGIRELRVVHSSTTIVGASGLQSSSTGSTGDTLLGSHQLVIEDTSGTGAFGTIAFLYGSTFTFSNADTNLEITGPGGEIIHVDTTSIAPGFSGSIVVQGAGEVSFDEGLSSTPLTFISNQQLIDSRDGTTINVDTSTVQRAGTDRVEFLQTADAFEALRLLRDELLAAVDLPSSVNTPRLQRRLEDVQRIQDHLLSQIGDQSVRLENLDHMQRIFEDQSSQTQIALSESSATDIPAAVIQLQETQNLYQYTLSTISRLYDSSLLNFLR